MSSMIVDDSSVSNNKILKEHIDRVKKFWIQKQLAREKSLNNSQSLNPEEQERKIKISMKRRSQR